MVGVLYFITNVNNKLQTSWYYKKNKLVAINNGLCCRYPLLLVRKSSLCTWYYDPSAAFPHNQFINSVSKNKVVPNVLKNFMKT